MTTQDVQNLCSHLKKRTPLSQCKIEFHKGQDGLDKASGEFGKECHCISYTGAYFEATLVGNMWHIEYSDQEKE